MGGAGPVTKNFRNANVDPSTFDALTELARIVGNDIYLAPIPGCGSYQTSTKASAGTHAGGGAVDINAEGLTDEQARRIETKARSLGFVAYFRPRVSPYSGNSYGWQRHVHMIRRDCGDLAVEAKAQIVAYDKGTDALAVPHKDTGSRAYVGMTWAKYRAAQAAAARPPTPAIIPEEDPLAGITLDQIAKAVWDYSVPNHDANRDGKPDGQSLTRSNIVMANWRTGQVQAAVASLAGQVAGLTAAVKQLAAGQTVDLEAITAAAKTGASEALAEKISDADVTLNVQP